MRFAAPNRDQLELRSTDVQVRTAGDRNIRFVGLNIVGTESLSEERFRKGPWPIEFLLELFPIIRSPIKPGMRIQRSEVRMTADMIPVCVSNEDGCQRREPRRIGMQRVIYIFCGIWACA